MKIFYDLKGIEYKIKMGKVKWADDCEILEHTVKTILRLTKTISTQGGHVKIPNTPMVCFC